jgi:transcriptional regulator with XRE-family HTH domain
MNEPLSSQLSRLRKTACLTNEQLATRAGVPRSLIAGLQSGKRRIGELQARKIGNALRLSGDVLEEFVMLAINNCSEKVLQESRSYPAELLNILARQLRKAGILPEQIGGCIIGGDECEQDVTVLLKAGGKAIIQTHLRCA